VKIWKFQNNMKKIFKAQILQQLGVGMLFYIMLQVMGEFSGSPASRRSSRRSTRCSS